MKTALENVADVLETVTGQKLDHVTIEALMKDNTSEGILFRLLIKKFDEIAKESARFAWNSSFDNKESPLQYPSKEIFLSQNFK